MASATKPRSYDPYRNMGYVYDGSAVRVLEDEEVLSPQPRVRPRYQQKTRPRVQVRPAGRVSLFAVTGFAAAAVLAVLILMSYVQLSDISSEVVDLNNQMTELRGEEASLRARYELAYDLGAIENSVTANGSMSRPQAGQIVYVDLTEPDSVVRYDAPEPSGGLLDEVGKIGESILSYF